MKRMILIVSAVVALVTGVAFAQQAPMSPKPESEHHMQGGMCPMMSGGMMGSGMMGMMGSQSDSPQMMQMRGEMMKAMGEVMMKYGKMMEGARR